MLKRYKAHLLACKPLRLISVVAVVGALTSCYGASEYAGLVDEEPGNEFDATSALDPFGDVYWAELAQEFEEFVPEPGIGAAIDADDRINKGRWGELIEWPEIAVGAANMTDGRIVTWASEVDDFFGGPQEVTTGSIFNPLTHTFEDAGYSGHNMFCAGISMLPDGQVFLAGGGLHVSSVSTFNRDSQFSEIDSMAMARWYPTSTTLPSGQVLTSLGTTASGFSELWTDGHGWQMLDNVNLQSALDFPYFYKDWYPALNVAPNGSLFHPGPNNEVFSLDLQEDDAYVDHGERETGGKDRLYNTTVVYDIGKMLVAGGGFLDAKDTALTIDLNGTTPVINSTSSMQHARSMQNSIVLPDGEVLVIGGNSSGKQFSDEGTVLTPELWNPETGQWRQLAPHQEPRNYHSTALLMQDARVISMGGGLCGACKTNHQNGEIFEPPYLFDADGNIADRPVITSGPDTASAGDTINLTASDNITRFTMVKLIAITHHHSTDQRLVPVEFNKTAANNFQLQLNDNPNVLIPGYYWIFGLDENGVPSVGHQIQVQVTADLVLSPETTDTNINYSYYEGNWDGLPDFDALTPVAEGTQANFSLNNRGRNSNYGFVFTGSIDVPESGIYTFYLNSDDGSRLTIGNQVVINHDGLHVFEGEKTGAKFLNAGPNPIKIEYFEKSGGDGLLLSWSGPDLERRPVTRGDLGSEVVAELAPAVPLPEPVSPLPVGKVEYSYYQGNWSKIPTFDSLPVVKTGRLDNISLLPRLQDNFYGFRFDVRISVETPGAYTFFTTSDDGSRLYVDGELVVNNDGLHGPIEESGLITLTTGEHDVRVEYFDKSGGDSLQVLWSGPGIAKAPLPQSVFVERTAEPEPEPVVAAVNPVTLPVDQLQYEVFDGVFTQLSNINGLAPDQTGATDTFSIDVADGLDSYGIHFSGKLQIDVADLYTFSLASDDGSRLFIDGNLIVDNDLRHRVVEKQNTVLLSEGLHNIVVEYFEWGGVASLDVLWARPGQAETPIPGSALYSVKATDADVGAAPIPPVAPTPTTPVTESGYSVAPVWDYDLYFGQFLNLPDFDALTPAVTSTTTSIDIGLSPVVANFAIRFRGTIEVTEEGVYTFYTTSDDGSRVSVNGQVVADNDGRHAAIERQGQVTLAAGVHDVEWTYFQGFSGRSLEAEWSGPGFARTALVPGDTTVQTAAALPDPATNTGDTQSDLPLPQLQFQYFEGDWRLIPDFGQLSSVRTGLANNFLTTVKGTTNQYGIRFDGLLEIETAGNYTFYVISNDGSRLTIDGQQVVNNDGLHGAVEEDGSVVLQPGLHAVQLDYFQNRGSEALTVFWSGPGFDRQLLPDSVLFHQP